MILPVVRYSSARKASKNPDYWDHATLLELAVLARDIDDAQEKLDDAFAVLPKPEPWQLKSTAGNLNDIFKSMKPANDLRYRFAVNAPTVAVEGLTIAGR